MGADMGMIKTILLRYLVMLKMKVVMGMIKKTKADMAAELAKGNMAKRAAQKRSTAKRSVTEKTGGEKDHTGSGASIIPTHVPTAATGAMISARPKRSHAGPGRTQHPR